MTPDQLRATQNLIAYAKSKGRVKRRYLDMDEIVTRTIKLYSKPQQWQFETKVGDLVRVCHSARMSETRNAPPLVPARITGAIRVTGVCANAVRLGEGCWVKSWVRVSR